MAPEQNARSGGGARRGAGRAARQAALVRREPAAHRRARGALLREPGDISYLAYDLLIIYTLLV